MLGKRDLLIRLTKDIKHNESNEDDQHGGGLPRRITQSHEGVNTRTWKSDDTGMLRHTYATTHTYNDHEPDTKNSLIQISKLKTATAR